MKQVLTLLSLFFCLSAFADCTYTMNEPQDSTWQSNFLGKGSEKKIQKIMKKKGYTLAQDTSTAEFRLKVVGESGYGCGTGLTMGDMLTIPGHYEIDFSRKDGNTLFERSGNFEGILFTEGRLGRLKFFRALRELPSCQSI